MPEPSRSFIRRKPARLAPLESSISAESSPQHKFAARRSSSHESVLPSQGDSKTIAQLRSRLAELETQLQSSQRAQHWLQSALGAERQSRFLLESSLAPRTGTSVSKTHLAVRACIPPEATVVVVSKGDPTLLDLDGREAWHFPRANNGEYAGFHPANSDDAIQHLGSLLALGAQFIVFPNSAFWWLEYYEGFRNHLEAKHVQIWHDDDCRIYELVPQDRWVQKAPAPTEPQACPSHLICAQPSPHLPASSSDIVCFPVIEWGFRFQRPQQLMSRLAGAGRRVFYISHAIRPSNRAYSMREVAPQVFEVLLRGPRIDSCKSILDPQSCAILLHSLEKLVEENRIQLANSVVQFPFWWPVAQRARSRFGWPIVYDCMDLHAGFSTSNPLALEHERELLVEADLVTASSAPLQSRASLANKNVLLIRNACDYEHFAKVKPKSVGGRPVIGYYGAISEWFDSDLVAALAQRRPDWDFILVGSTFGADTTPLSNRPNVFLAGEQPYSKLPEWLARFDVTILPFKHTPLTQATNPVKAYEIFAAGKPLVSVPLPESLLMRHVIRLASNAPEFEREIERELVQPNSRLRRIRQAFARANTWARRSAAFGAAVDRLLLEKLNGFGPGRPARHVAFDLPGTGQATVPERSKGLIV